MSIVSILAIVAMAWQLATLHAVPACKAVINMSNTLDGQVRETSLLVNVIPSRFREVTFLLDGQVASEQGISTLSRVVDADYDYRQGYYYFSVKDVKKKSVDNMNDADIVATAAVINSPHFIFKIGSLDDNRLVFSSNIAPSFVCTKS
ncbi:hypothetical protein [Serratia marcescens]|uniref:hypothetical protein n=1 Tax=Serratia marcescens TaxID=615 RepID=UPI0015D75C14|nr:hypothetical protein [Serratia marcescens]QLJ67568.1 hypothetical protein HP437_21330 [Serratia marcescens]